MYDAMLLTIGAVLGIFLESILKKPRIKLEIGGTVRFDGHEHTLLRVKNNTLAHYLNIDGRSIENLTAVASTLESGTFEFMGKKSPNRIIVAAALLGWQKINAFGKTFPLNELFDSTSIASGQTAQLRIITKDNNAGQFYIARQRDTQKLKNGSVIMLRISSDKNDRWIGAISFSINEDDNNKEPLLKIRRRRILSERWRVRRLKIKVTIKKLSHILLGL